jgi:hypothetical protein
VNLTDEKGSSLIGCMVKELLNVIQLFGMEYRKMSTIKTLKRAWQMVWTCRALWLFGAILALTTATAVYLGPWRDQQNADEWIKIKFTESFIIKLPGEGLTIDLSTPERVSIWLDSGKSPREVHTIEEFLNEVISPNILLILIETATILAILILLGTIARYVAETALIRMVDRIEETGAQTLSLRQGLVLGWSRRAGRLFLLDLSVYLLAALAFILIFLLTLTPLLLIATGSIPAIVIGAVGTFGLIILAGYLLFAGSVFLSLVMQPVKRACIQDNLGITASFRRGFSIIRGNLKQVIMVWSIWIVIRILWIPLSFLCAILMAPILLLTILLGILAGAIPGVLVAGVASLFAEGVTPWIMGAIAGTPIFLLVMLTPMLFLAGLVQVFISSMWTLAYRAWRAKEVVVRTPLPASPPVVVQGMVEGMAD